MKFNYCQKYERGPTNRLQSKKIISQLREKREFYRAGELERLGSLFPPWNSCENPKPASSEGVSCKFENISLGFLESFYIYLKVYLVSQNSNSYRKIFNAIDYQVMIDITFIFMILLVGHHNH